MKRTLLCGVFPLLFVVAGTAAAQDPVVAEPSKPRPTDAGKPIEISMPRAGSTTIDLRDLPAMPVRRRDRPEREEPFVVPVPLPGGVPGLDAPGVPGRNAPAPSPLSNFLGLDFLNWGAGRPPDPNGDVGPTHFIQAVNTSIGIYRKSDSVRVAAFTFDTLMSQGNFGNLCDTDNFGDPVILYDSFEDRWVITDFAFQLDGLGNVINPPGAFQCFAVSKSGDPVSGGWNYYSLHLTDGLNDYPKFGVWPDGIYMAANMFGFPASGSFLGTRVWALNKAEMYAGAPSIQVVQFSPPTSEFTFLPANARLQAGTPPPGSPNLFSVVWQFTNAVSVYKFHVDWNSISLSAFTGPFISIAPSSWISPPGTVPSQGGNNNDTLAVRLMMQNQYTKLGGVESLWTTHTVRNPTTAGVSAVRYYQTDVTGGTVAANTTQAATHAPDTTNRYMPSLAVDRAGNMALGYSASSAALFPAIRYAGRLSSDAVNTLPQTETSLVEGTGSQNTSTRWGDYSAMSLDPNGCTFWYTNEYYITTGNNWQTRVGSFQFPSCTPVTTGTVQGTVTATAGGAPISGATISFGSRTTTTAGSGFYQFLGVPSGTYPSIAASAPGYNSSSATSIVVTDGSTTTQDFSLGTAPVSACLTDTTQADFQTGVPTNVDLTTSPGNVTLLSAANIDQQNTSVTNSGNGFTSTSWFGQTFTAGVTGQLTAVDVNLFCFLCTGTTPNITVSIQAASGNLPTGADLGTATIPGFSSGAGGFFNATFASPVAVTSGTQYAIVVRGVSNPSAGTYAYVVSTGSPYAGGRLVISSNSGGTWAGQTPDADIGFKTYVKSGFALSGDLVSSLKDSNPPVGPTPSWTTFSWTASTPANTTLRFQVAGSNSALGPFNFVGPDGTAATFFTTSGASLSLFNGNRYLKYKVTLSTTNSAVSPTLNDVTLCYTNGCTPPATPTITPGGPTTFCAGGSVTLTSSSASGNQWYLNGSPIGGATGQPYIATASGNYTVVVTASGCSSIPSAATTVTVNPVPATPVVTAPTTVGAGSPNRTGGVPAHAGSTYAWGITNGTITAGQGTDQITFTAGTAGTPLTLSVTETAASGCASAPGTATVTVLQAGSSVLFYTATPCRQLDTRSGSPISPGGTLTVALTGAPCGIPSGATSVSVNAAVTQEAGSGHLTIYPADKTQPLVSNINFNVGQTRANNSVLSLSSDGTGSVNVVNGSGGTTHVVIDVNGYFQ